MLCSWGGGGSSCVSACSPVELYFADDEADLIDCCCVQSTGEDYIELTFCRKVLLVLLLMNSL